MKLDDIITNTKTPYTKQMLLNDFRKMNIDYGDIVLVHASLSSIGYIIGGVETLFDALFSAVGALGTIVVPTQTRNNSDPKNWVNPPVPKEWIEEIKAHTPAFDKKTTPSEMMGKLSEYIRVNPNSERSSHPQVSFSAIGFHAKKICKTHQLTPMFGMDTPLGTLYKLDNVKILMIGTDVSKITGLHLAEALSRKYNKKEMNGCAMRIDNKRQWIDYQDFAYDNTQFCQIVSAYEKESNLVIKDNVGKALATVFDFKSLIDFGIKYLDR